MIRINFKVTEKQVLLLDCSDELVSGNMNNIQCTFDLSSAFDNLVVKAVFNDKARTIVSGECYAPLLSAGKCLIGVYGYSVKADNTFERIISPVPVSICIPQGSYNEDVNEITPPSPSELDSYYDAVKRLLEENKNITMDFELSVDSNNAIANCTVANILSEGQLSAIKLVDGHEKYEALREYQQSIAAGKYAIVYMLHDIYLDDDIEDESKLEMYQGTYILTSDNMHAVSLGGNTIMDMLDYITASYVKYSDYQEQIKAIIMLIDAIVKSCANEDLTQKRFDAVNERLEKLEQAAGSLVNANEVKY